MTNKLKQNSLFYTLKKFISYKGIFIVFFIVFVIPLLILQSIIIKQFYYPIMTYGISAILYLTMFLFVNSFIVLYGLSGEKMFSFLQVLKFLPSIIPVIILPLLIFTILFIIVKSFFLIAPFLLFVFIPIVSFATLFNKNLTVSEVFDSNKNFMKLTIGKRLLKNIFALSFILVIIVFILKKFMWPFLWHIEEPMIFSIYYVLSELLSTISFFIIYITIVNTYSTYSFKLPGNISKIANNILAETKNIRKKHRNISSTRHTHKKESFKDDIFDFEKKEKESKQKYKKEKNRFTDDGGFNRFEDTKY